MQDEVGPNERKPLRTKSNLGGVGRPISKTFSTHVRIAQSCLIINSDRVFCCVALVELGIEIRFTFDSLLFVLSGSPWHNTPSSLRVSRPSSECGTYIHCNVLCSARLTLTNECKCVRFHASSIPLSLPTCALLCSISRSHQGCI